jgi:hypothetical protein
MKWLFVLLLLANASLAAYTHWKETRKGGDAELVKLQMNADKVRLLQNEGVVPPMKLAAAIAGAQIGEVRGACLEWGTFVGADIGRAEAALARLQLQDKATQREAADNSAFWVYIPPLKNKAEIDKKIAELKALRIEDFVVLQDNNQWRNAISLGIFRSSEAANSQLARLRDKGLQSAVAGARSGLVKQSTFVIRDPGDLAAARLAGLRPEFPGAELHAVQCPAG